MRKIDYTVAVIFLLFTIYFIVMAIGELKKEYIVMALLCASGGLLSYLMGKKLKY